MANGNRPDAFSSLGSFLSSASRLRSSAKFIRQLAQMAQMPGQAKIDTGLSARGAFGARTDLVCESAIAREHDLYFISWDT